MRQSKAWLKALWHWAAEWKHFWVAIGVVVVALLFAIRPGTSERFVRLSGLVLQILGIGTVAWGISETRALFGMPSFAGVVLNWISRIPRLGGRKVTTNGTITSPHIIVRARAYEMALARTGSSAEERISVLERNIQQITVRINEAFQEMDASTRTASTALQQEHNSRVAAEKEIREKLEATGTGGIHISAMGALWLFVGVILSTASQEIAKCLG